MFCYLQNFTSFIVFLQCRYILTLITETGECSSIDGDGTWWHVLKRIGLAVVFWFEWAGHEQDYVNECSTDVRENRTGQVLGWTVSISTTRSSPTPLYSTLALSWWHRRRTLNTLHTVLLCNKHPQTNWYCALQKMKQHTQKQLKLKKTKTKNKTTTIENK